jgi:hypothetical protein
MSTRNIYLSNSSESMRGTKQGFNQSKGFDGEGQASLRDAHPGY